MHILVMKSGEKGWQLEGDAGSMGNSRAFLYANGHKPVVPDRLVAHERESITKGAKLWRGEARLAYRAVFGKRKDKSYISTGK